MSLQLPIEKAREGVFWTWILDVTKAIERTETGDIYHLTTDSGGKASVTFNVAYLKKPNVQLSVEGANNRVAISSLPKVSDKWATLEVHATDDAGANVASAIVHVKVENIP